MARRSLSTEDETLWQAFARTILPLRARHGRKPPSKAAVQSVEAVAGEAAQVVPGKRRPGQDDVAPVGTARMGAFTVREVMRTAPPVTRSRRVHERLEINGRQPGLDTTSWNALATGKMKPQKRLDLHGHFAQDAFHKLHHFLHAASRQGVRCVEVITGLGSGQEGGVIRQELPHWLERGDLRPLILAVVHTHKKNKGAVRILLRARDRL